MVAVEAEKQAEQFEKSGLYPLPITFLAWKFEFANVYMVCVVSQFCFSVCYISKNQIFAVTSSKTEIESNTGSKHVDILMF